MNPQMEGVVAQAHIKLIINRKTGATQNLKVSYPKIVPDGAQSTIYYPRVVRFEGRKAVVVAQSEDRTSIAVADDLVQLTKFDDADDISVEKSLYHRSAALADVDPYMDQKLAVIMERVFPITTFDWLSTDTSGTSLQQFSFPATLDALPYLADQIARFRFLQTDIELTVRVNSTPFHYGQLMVAWTPYRDVGGMSKDPLFRIYTAASGPHALVSANQRSTVKLTIPQITPRLYIDRSAVDQTVSHSTVEIFVFSPLRQVNMTATASVSVTVFASFKNFKFAGIMAQADVLDKEAEAKSKDRSVSDKLSTISDNALIFAKSPIGEYAVGFAAFTKMLSKVFRAAGYSKETDREVQTRVVQFATSNFALGTGIDLCEKLALDGNNHIARQHSIFGTKYDYDLLSELVLIPTLYPEYAWDGSQIAGTRLLNIPVSPSLSVTSTDVALVATSSAPFVHLAFTHQFWRGSMKYSIRFITSSFISGRVRIVWQPIQGPATMTSEGANIISTVVDVVGDTVFNFTVPYLHSMPYLQTTQLGGTVDKAINQYCNGYISVYVVNPLIAGQVSASIDCNIRIFASGGEDLTFSLPSRNASILAQSKEIVDDLHTRDMFKKTFPPLIPASVSVSTGLCMGEHTSRVTQMLSRATEFGTVTIAAGAFTTLYPHMWLTNPLSIVALTSPSAEYYTFFRLVNMFHYWRGSLKIRLVPQGATTSYLTSLNTASGAGGSFMGSTVWQANIKPVAEVEIPFYEPSIMHTSVSHEVQTTFGTTGLSIRNTGTASVTFSVYMSIGEDFTLGFPEGGYLADYDP